MGTIKTSRGQQRILDVLADGKPHSSFSICMDAEVVSPSTYISELTAQGFHISTLPGGRSARGARITYFQWLAPKQEVVAA
jgi:hypothetical protein